MIMEIEVSHRTPNGSHAANGALRETPAADSLIDGFRCHDLASVNLADGGLAVAPLRRRRAVETPRAGPLSSYLAAVIAALALAACGGDFDAAAVPDAPVVSGGENLAEKAPQAPSYFTDQASFEDILWRNSITGEFAHWHMQGNTIVGLVNGRGSSSIHPFAIRTNLVGDDCLETVYRTDDGAVFAERAINSAGVCVTRSPITSYRFNPPGWSLIDVEGRYGGGTRNQLLWRNTQGTVAIWSLGADGTIAASGFPATAPLEWTIVDGRGDYDGDGRSDILWRNSAGTVAMWRMTSISAIAGTVFFGTAPTATWTLADAAGDYDGNGRSDLLWIDQAGSVVIWNLNPANGTFTAAPVGNVGAGWRVLDGSVDFDGDRKSDIVLQGPAGEVVMWLMNGSRIKSSRQLATLSAEWRMVARNAP
jgi:hypothetical protein